MKNKLTKRTIEKIDELIQTRINGNKIKGNKTYENMLKSISILQLIEYANKFGYKTSLSWYKKTYIINDMVSQILFRNILNKGNQ